MCYCCVHTLEVLSSNSLPVRCANHLLVWQASELHNLWKPQKPADACCPIEADGLRGVLTFWAKVLSFDVVIEFVAIPPTCASVTLLFVCRVLTREAPTAGLELTLLFWAQALITTQALLITPQSAPGLQLETTAPPTGPTGMHQQLDSLVLVLSASLSLSSSAMLTALGVDQMWHQSVTLLSVAPATSTRLVSVTPQSAPAPSQLSAPTALEATMAMRAPIAQAAPLPMMAQTNLAAPMAMTLCTVQEATMAMTAVIIRAMTMAWKVHTAQAATTVMKAPIAQAATTATMVSTVQAATTAMMAVSAQAVSMVPMLQTAQAAITAATVTAANRAMANKAMARSQALCCLPPAFLPLSTLLPTSLKIPPGIWKLKQHHPFEHFYCCVYIHLSA